MIAGVEAQRQLDQKQRVAAGALSAEDVLEGYVSSIFQKLQGKGRGKSMAEATGVDFKSMMPAVGSDVAKSVVLVDDIDEAEKNKRLHSKKQLEELKQLKHQRKLANGDGSSKNYQSPGGAQGHNASSSTKAKQKGKGKGKASGASQKGKGKGSGKKQKPELPASEPKPKKGQGKGKNKKGKGK